jgi:hypothetical protein
LTLRLGSREARPTTEFPAAAFEGHGRELPALAEGYLVTTPAPRDAWDEIAAQDPDALVTQTPAWTDCVCGVSGMRDVSRLYDFGGGRRLVLPLVRAGGRPARAAREASLGPAWGFGGLLGERPRVEEVGSVLADLRTQPALQVRVRPNPLHHATWSAARPQGIVRLERRAHAIDLRDGFDEVWKRRFSSRARNHVRRAVRAGVRVQLDTRGEHVAIFHQLFMRSVERWAQRSHEPLRLARWRAARRDPEQKLHRLLSDLGDQSRLWVAWVGQRPAAAILVLQGANAHYTRGAMDVEVAGPARANYLLHREAIEDACRAGCSTYHMGETGSSGSLAQFKEAVGAQAHPYAEYVAERLPLTRIDRGVRAAVKRAVGFRDDG